MTSHRPVPFVLLCMALLATSWSAPRPAPGESDSRDHRRLLRLVDRAPDPDHLREMHQALASRPHRAGTPGDRLVIETIADRFRDLGLETEVQELQVYLAEPVRARVALVRPVALDLPLSEETLDQDPWTREADSHPGWSAYSGSGQATGKVVYANYGRKEDFEKLRELGVATAGRIVIARFGGNFRGYKAKYAEEAGASGLLIYTDPEDSGWDRGLLYPEGGWAHPSQIQRGSLLTLPWRGDPLTPFRPATPGARRLDPAGLELPRIPVQPLGWKAAQEILSRMGGEAAPRDWQGGLPFPYRLTGGDGLEVRLEVEQERRLVRTANVTGTLKGSRWPEQKVVFGAHHDAWIYGAGDPLSGTILVLEGARSFARAAEKGLRPARSLVFAAWAAEEYGIIGSVEWIEAHAASLGPNGVAYLNADMAAMGTRFSSSADPFLKAVLAEAARSVPHPDEGEGSVLEEWLSRGEDSGMPGEPPFGDLGGGSDHIGFLCHLGIPSAGIRGGGSPGSSYHSLYDNLHWYRQVVGDDYASAHMLTRVANIALARLADKPLLPLDFVRPAVDMQRHIESLRTRIEELGFDPPLEGKPLTRLESASRAFVERASKVRRHLDPDALEAAEIEYVNREVLAMTRAWVHPAGLPGRPWFRNLYAASDETSGYASWMLPGLRWAVEARDGKAVLEQEELLLEALDAMGRSLRNLEAVGRGHEARSRPVPSPAPTDP